MSDRELSTAPVRQVALGSIGAFVVVVAGAGLTCCSQLVIARIVGADTYGIYAYVLAWMIVLAYLCALGFDVALLRFIPIYRTEKAWALLRGVIQYAERRSMVASGLVIVIGTFVVVISIRMSSAELMNTFLIGFILVPVTALLAIRCSIVRAFGGVVSALAPDRIIREGALLGFVVVAGAGLGQHISASAAMTAMLASSSIGLGFATVAAYRAQSRAVAFVSPVYAAPIWRQTALPLVILGATELLMNRTGVLLLGWLGDTRNAGIYSLVFNIAFVATLPRMAINTIFAPTISGLFAQKDLAMLQILVARTSSWILVGGTGISVILIFVAAPLLAWFGRDFEAGAPALRILLLGQMLVSCAGSQLHLMTMTGHERNAAMLLLATAACNVIGSVALISMMGLIGAAVAAATALVGWNVAMAYFLWRRLHVLPGMLAQFLPPPQTQVSN